MAAAQLGDIAKRSLRPALKWTLTGDVLRWLGTVAAVVSRPEWNPVPLKFETIEEDPGLPDSYSLTILGVERDIHGIRINYEIVPPLPQSLRRVPHGEARDDRGREYDDLGGAFGPATSGDRTDGVLTMPLPPHGTSLLEVRMSWAVQDAPLWERPAQALRISV